MIVDQFNEWLLVSSAGDVTEYYTGLLAKDSGPFADKLIDRPAATLRELAATVYAAAEEGLILLTQKRLGEDEYVYLATKTSEPKRWRHDPPRG
mgnify:CR=1 FL=1|tara:strand:+ start:247 stop:528 length:282 start_codon:yes stop_codon:yes gene_type:complete